VHGICQDLPRDERLDGVLSRLDPADMLAVLRAQLSDVAPEVRDRWRKIVALDAAYHPARYVRIAFALLSDPDTPGNRVWPEGDLVYLHAPVRRPMSRRGQVIRVGEDDVEVYRFPNDRRLRGLRKFASATSAPERWQHWIERNGRAEVLDAATLQRRFIRYTPEYKWIIRLRAEVRDPATGEIAKRRIAVRCASPASCRGLARRHAVASRVLSRISDDVRVPQVLGWEADAGLLAVEWDRGDPLLEALKSDDRAIEAFAHALRWLHGAQIPGLPTLASERVGESIAAAVKELAVVCPELAGIVTEMANDLCRGLGDLEPVHPVTLHNDLHLHQVLAKRGRFTFLDLERMSLGDPLIDIANFAAQLSILPHRRDFAVEPERAARWRARFLASLFEQTGEVFDDPRFHWFAAAAFLRHAHGAMRHLRPGWRDTVQTCVRLAESELTGRRGRAGVR